MNKSNKVKELFSIFFLPVVLLMFAIGQPLYYAIAYPLKVEAELVDVENSEHKESDTEIVYTTKGVYEYMINGETYRGCTGSLTSGDIENKLHSTETIRVNRNNYTKIRDAKICGPVHFIFAIVGLWAIIRFSAIYIAEYGNEYDEEKKYEKD